MNTQTEIENTPENIQRLPSIPAVFHLVKDGLIIGLHETLNLKKTISSMQESYTKGGFEFSKIVYTPLILKKQTLKDKLKHIKASMPHPMGIIKIDLEFTQKAVIGTIELPMQLTGELMWQGKKMPIVGGVQYVQID